MVFQLKCKLKIVAKSFSKFKLGVSYSAYVGTGKMETGGQVNYGPNVADRNCDRAMNIVHQKSTTVCLQTVRQML